MNMFRQGRRALRPLKIKYIEYTKNAFGLRRYIFFIQVYTANLLAFIPLDDAALPVDVVCIFNRFCPAKF